MSLQRTLRRLSTRTIPAPTTAVSGTDNPRALRRRTIRNAAALAARSMAKVFVAPGIQDATRTVRSLIEDLKPAVFQAPRANDAAIREALARAEEMLGDIQTAGETTDSLCVADINSPAARFRWQLQESSDFLQSWTQRLKTLQRPSYLTKLANQDETSQQLAEYNRRSADHLGRLMLKGVALGSYGAVRSQEGDSCNAALARAVQREPSTQAEATENVADDGRGRTSIRVDVLYLKIATFFFLTPLQQGAEENIRLSV
ncbi:hypothetical protein FRC08_006874 [Ceratobasidium sp. 394]|nr:hypothetical protein FRC08_006874 [Ceratobasidium sp. 394]KAG9077427.1 hypothetical protein FS749_010678 [Ceratobasidium sp. UAMH 11750]